MAHSSPHKVIFFIVPMKKNSKGNIYQAGCASAEPVARLCRTSTTLRVMLQHQTVVEANTFYDHAASYFPYIQPWSNISCQR